MVSNKIWQKRIMSIPEEKEYCKFLRWYSSIEGFGDYHCALGNKTSSEWCERKERCADWEKKA